MRPNITEQLQGLSRTLSEVIAPEVHSPYPAEILGSVIGALDALESSWSKIPAFLQWDIAETAAVLAAAKPMLGADLAAEIDAAIAEVSVDAADWTALEASQTRLRGLLVKAMPVLANKKDSDAYRRMIALFHERTERFPFSMAARPPAKKP
jgi:hypothetical protein